jgi:cytochrome c556
MFDMKLRYLPCYLLPFLLAACSANEPPTQFRPDASIQEVMASVVDPAADAVWEAVSSETTAQGIVEHQPRTDAEWLAIRHHAVTLAEAANLLLIEGRVVSHTNQLEDAHVPGILSAADVQKKIDADRKLFAARAQELRAAAREAVAAIDAKHPQRLLAAGEKIDAACESCHMTYWYPNAEQPKWPAPLTAAVKP